MSSETANWAPLDRMMMDAHRNPSLLRLDQKELRKQFPHLVRELHLQQQKNLKTFQQKWRRFRKKQNNQPTTSHPSFPSYPTCLTPTQRPPRPSSQWRPSPALGFNEEVEEVDPINRVLSKGHPTVLSVVQEFDAKAEYDFTRHRDEVDYFLKGITEGGVGLTAAHRQGGSHAQKLEHLEECIPKANFSLIERIREKEEEMRQKEEEMRQKESELEELKALKGIIEGDLTSVRDRLREIVDKTSSTLRGVQVANPTSVSNGSPFCNINLTPLSYEKSLPNTPNPILQTPNFQRPMVDDDVGDFEASSRKRGRFER